MKSSSYSEWHKQGDEISEELNIKLKTIKTYEEFVKFQKEMYSYEYGFDLYGKRRKFKAFSFSHLYDVKKLNGEPYWFTGMDKYKNRIRYLYEDGVSTGESYVKNLYRVLEVRY